MTNLKSIFWYSLFKEIIDIVIKIDVFTVRILKLLKLMFTNFVEIFPCMGLYFSASLWWCNIRWWWWQQEEDEATATWLLFVDHGDGKLRRRWGPSLGDVVAPPPLPSSPAAASLGWTTTIAAPSPIRRHGLRWRSLTYGRRVLRTVEVWSKQGHPTGRERPHTLPSRDANERRSLYANSMILTHANLFLRLIRLKTTSFITDNLNLFNHFV